MIDSMAWEVAFVELAAGSTSAEGSELVELSPLGGSASQIARRRLAFYRYR